MEKTIIKKETEIQEIQEIPSYLKNAELYDGDIQLDIDDVRPSFLKLATNDATLVKEGACKPGEFIDNGTRENYGESVEVVIVKHFKDWYKEENKVKLLSRDGEHWENGDKISDYDKKCATRNNFLVLIRNKMIPIPVNLRITKGSWQTARDLLNTTRRDRASGLGPFCRGYILGSAIPTGQDYLSITMRPGTYLDEKEMAVAQKVYTALANAKIRVDRENQVVKTDIELDLD